MSQLTTGQGAGKPLPSVLRSGMETSFGADFSQVRLHDDAPAHATSQMLNANAFTTGEDIYLGHRRPPVSSTAGRYLLAHELTHVLQQRRASQGRGLLNTPHDAHEKAADRAAVSAVHGQRAQVAATGATPAVQRQAVAGGGATPGSGEGIDVIFIIRADDDQFTADVTKYVKTVLTGQVYFEVDNLDELFVQLAHLQTAGSKKETPGSKKAGGSTAAGTPQKVRRIRIVAHGSTTGGVKMTPPDETDRRWFTPDEVKKFASQKSIQETAKKVMAPGARVEFWGCNIGNVDEAGEAWRDLFGADFSATTGTFRTGNDQYYRRAEKGEEGETFPGSKGRWVRVTHTKEVDARSSGLKKHFRNWLLQRYNELEQNGDISPIKGKEARVKYMRDLFNRSAGDIKFIQVERKSDNKLVRPGGKKWAKLWKRFTVEP